MSETARRIAAQGWFEVTAILSNGEQILLNVIMPLMAVIILAKTNLIATQDNGLEKLDLALVAGISLAVMSSAFTSVAIATGFDRRAGFLRYLGTTPLRRGGLISGKVVAVGLLVAIQFVMMIGTALILGWRFDGTGLLITIVPLILATGAFTAWALLLAGTLRAEAVLALANLIWLGLVMTAGATLVGNHLPDVIGNVAHFLPSGAIVNGIEASIGTHSVAWGPLGVLTIWLVAGVASANRWFKWD